MSEILQIQVGEDLVNLLPSGTFGADPKMFKINVFNLVNQENDLYEEVKKEIKDNVPWKGEGSPLSEKKFFELLNRVEALLYEGKTEEVDSEELAVFIAVTKIISAVAGITDKTAEEAGQEQETPAEETVVEGQTETAPITENEQELPAAEEPATEEVDKKVTEQVTALVEQAQAGTLPVTALDKLAAVPELLEFVAAQREVSLREKKSAFEAEVAREELTNNFLRKIGAGVRTSIAEVLPQLASGE